MGMDELNRQDIENLLQELGNALTTKFRQPVKVMLIGGAYMILTLHNRKTTKDIDIYPLNIPDSQNADKDTKKFMTAVRAVAKRHSMSKDWLNDVSFNLLGGLSPETME